MGNSPYQNRHMINIGIVGKYIFTLMLILAFSEIQAQDSSKSAEEELIFVTPEILPTFPGGDSALAKYLERKLSKRLWLQDSYRADKGYYSFRIDTIGNVFDAKMERSICPNIDSVIIAIISEFPRWRPGGYYLNPKDGTVLRKDTVKMTIPVSVRFREDNTTEDNPEKKD